MGDGRWQKGESGNLRGRPLGSKHRLEEAFLKDFCEIWEKAGRKALQRVLEDDPATFVRVAASLMPKDLTLNHEPPEFNPEEVLAELADLCEQANADALAKSRLQ
jgi:hypothetical protein